MNPLKRYTVLYTSPEGLTALAKYDAHHYSVSNSTATPVAHFYRLTQRDKAGRPGAEHRDILVGSVIAPLTITEDGDSNTVELFGRDLGEDMADAVMDALNLENLDDGVKLRLVVSVV